MLKLIGFSALMLIVLTFVILTIIYDFAAGAPFTVRRKLNKGYIFWIIFDTLIAFFIIGFLWYDYFTYSPN